jgi:hypothetical protein
MWTEVRNSEIPPQKQPYMWTEVRNSEVPPQKQPYMWMNGVAESQLLWRQNKREPRRTLKLPFICAVTTALQ